MARYVLIEVDDNEAANRLMTKLSQLKGMRIAGLFGVPQQYCECPKDEGYHQDKMVVRGSKLGWWVHRTCRRARRGTHQLQNLISPAEREYGKLTGIVNVVSTVSIFDAPRQNLK